MKNAYASAAMRMRQDAEHLSQGGRLGTPDHLFGLAAECALKAVLHAKGVLLEPPALPPRDYRKHIDGLWPEYQAWASTTGVLLLASDSLFTDWNVSDRYHHDDCFSPMQVARHREGARFTAELLERAAIDGVVQ